MSKIFTEDQLTTVQGIRRTRALFEEVCRSVDTPIMSLRPQGRTSLVSLRDIFIELVENDPTETELAETVFGSMEHWRLVCSCNWFKPYLEEWRSICDSKRKAKAFMAIIKEVETGGRASLSAAKYLIDEPWKNKKDSKTNKISKETTEKAFDLVSEDYERLKEEGYLQ